MQIFRSITCPHCRASFSSFGGPVACPRCGQILPPTDPSARSPGRNPLTNKFVWLGLAAVGLCLGLVVFWTTRTKTHTVLFFESAGGDQVRVSCVGPLEFRLNGSMQLEPNYWKAGNVFVLRSDQQLRDVSGQAGHAYQFRKDESLRDLGLVDLHQTNEQIAASFGVKSSAPPKQ
ncbi:MAG: hypothetical protein PSU94_17245 [Lacunisphaera sp.]|nr:hypothetical protein [Lacunisphaera sp.]